MGEDLMKHLFGIISIALCTQAIAVTYPVEQKYQLEDVMTQFLFFGTPEYGKPDYTVTAGQAPADVRLTVIGTSTCHSGSGFSSMAAFEQEATFGATEYNTWCACRLLRPFVTHWFMPSAGNGTHSNVQYYNPDHCLYSCGYDCANSLIQNGIPLWVRLALRDQSIESEFYGMDAVQEPVIAPYAIARSALGYSKNGAPCTNGGVHLSSFNSAIADARACKEEGGEHRIDMCFLYSAANTTRHSDNAGTFVHTGDCLYENE